MLLTDPAAVAEAGLHRLGEVSDYVSSGGCATLASVRMARQRQRRRRGMIALIVLFAERARVRKGVP
jgi:hypothetical protein